MKREKLLDDLWQEDAQTRRNIILKTGAGVLRRRRWIRRSQQCCAALMVIIAASLAVKRAAEMPASQVISKAPAVPVVVAHSLTDEELLALFPDTPVALASLSNGKKRLIFLRAEDRERFVGDL